MFYRDEKLSDNTHQKLCKQCENCAYWGNDPDNYMENAFDKSCCEKYPYPLCKPDPVRHNTGKCEFKKERING